MRNTFFRLAATAFLLLAIGLEMNHSFIRQVAWRGFEPAANFVSFPLIAAWGLAIAGLWLSNAMLKPWLVFGIFFLVMHGIVISTGENGLGAAYIFLGLASAVCAAFSHTKKEIAQPQARGRASLRIAS